MTNHITPSNATQTGDITIDGTPTQGQTLKANTTNLADPDGLGSLSYQWKHGNNVIDGATQDTYTLTQDDVGQTINITDQKAISDSAHATRVPTQP